MKRNPALDGVRGIAIFLIVLQHYFASYLHDPLRPFPFVVSRITGLGWTSIDLFFLLSGFLICGILLDNRGSPGMLRVFWARRVCRIVPLYAVVVGACLIGRALIKTGPIGGPGGMLADPCPVWRYLTFTQNYALARTPYFGCLSVTWTVCVEEQFYILLPLLVVLLDRKGLLALFAAVFAFAVAGRALRPGDHNIYLLPWRGDGLLAGAALAIAVRTPALLERFRRHRPALRGLLVAMAVLWAAVFLRRERPHGMVTDSLFLAAIWGTLVLNAHLSPDGRLANAMKRLGFCYLGRISYGLYLTHEIFQGLAFRLIGHRWVHMGRPLDVLTVAAAGTAAVAFAHVSFHHFEKPILALGHRLTYRPGPAVPPDRSAPAEMKVWS